MAAAHLKGPARPAALEQFTNTLARHFQVRDDYMNLVSGEVRPPFILAQNERNRKVEPITNIDIFSPLQYESMKGFCEDLDEGKYSLPIIYVLKTQPQNYQLIHLLATGRKQGSMTKDQKKLVLSALGEAGAMEYTRSVLHNLHMEIKSALAKLEEIFGSKNSEMVLLVELLRV